MPGWRVSSVGDCETLRVDLFDPTKDTESYIREVQRTFRDWMDFDGLEERLPELESVMGDDPSVEILFGEFSGGGTLRYVEYLDDSRKPVVKSRATQAFVVERDEEQKVVFQGFEPLN